MRASTSGLTRPQIYSLARRARLACLATVVATGFSAPPYAAIAADPAKPADKAPAQAKEAAEAKAKVLVDYPAIPDGSPAEILAFIDRVKQLQPPARDLPTVIEHLQKVHGIVIAAVDKLGTAGNEEEQTQAIAAKLGSLQMLRRVETAGADQQMRTYLDQLLADKRPFVPPLAKVYHIATQLQEVDKGDHAQLEKLLSEVREHLKTAKLDARNLGLAFQTAMLLERAGLTKLALEAYVEFAGAFAVSDDPAVAENSKMLAGAARFLSLPGKSMDITGKTLEGKDFDLKKLTGKVVLVDFWATWCGPCVAELPTLLDCYDKYHDRGFEVIGISLDDDRERLDAFMKREEVPWPVIFNDDPKAMGWKAPLASHYGVMSIPRAVLIDRKGNVVSLTAHGDALWDLLAAQIGPPEVKKPEDDVSKDDKKPAEKPEEGKKPEEKKP